MHRYDFKVHNKAGSAEGNIVLEVMEEEVEEAEEEKVTMGSHSVPVREFGDYVAEMHAKNNIGFVTQFQVSTQPPHHYLSLTLDDAAHTH